MRECVRERERGRESFSVPMSAFISANGNKEDIIGHTCYLI